MMQGHPLDGLNFGVAGTIRPLVGIRPGEGRLPERTRAAPDVAAGKGNAAARSTARES